MRCPKITQLYSAVKQPRLLIPQQVATPLDSQSIGARREGTWQEFGDQRWARRKPRNRQFSGVSCESMSSLTDITFSRDWRYQRNGLKAPTGALLDEGWLGEWTF
ncbi:hypothetical protein NDU88_000853 [Pleurodeles waltl]|uniref:Uncharacterized protein n=1 Tax=Pleurodeles waltl TaxID=8319 RepID=A0AAV7S6D8_PLEWA|nr:hypothetical protein NDU88_000853 [Pleurodeles waltl]